MEPVARAIDNALIRATVEAVRVHAPFNAMSATDLQWMVTRLSVVYFAPGTSILGPDHGVPNYFFLIRQGRVIGLDPGSWAPLWRLEAGEGFPIGALLGNRAVTCLYRADRDTFCWRLSAEDFRALLERSAPLRTFCSQRLSSLLATSKRRMQREYAEEIVGDPLAQPLAQLLRREPVCCNEDDSLATALAKMRDARVGSIVVCRHDGGPAGIFTLRDLRDRIAFERLRPDVQIRTVMTPSPVTLPLHASALDAALLLARRGFHHIVVTDDSRVAGVVSEGDLFALRRVGMTSIADSIRAAANIDALVRAAADIRRLAESLVAQGVAADQLTRVISALNDTLTSKVVALESAAASVDPRRFCWLALGSEGRQEQTLATDQDNAIIFEASVENSDEARQSLLPLAQRINDALAQCGFPLCRGEVMASNPRWCLSLPEWQEIFLRWITKPDAQALLNAAIFFDFRGLCGDLQLADRLRAWLAPRCAGSAVFLRLMAQNALHNEPPLGLVRDFVVGEHAGKHDTIDLKLNGITPFVDAARILTLASGATHTSTTDRLRAVSQRRGFDLNEANAWIDGFHFVQMVRLRHQQEQVRQGQSPDNYLQPDRLNALDQRILKEALRQARKLQQRLRIDFHL